MSAWPEAIYIIKKLNASLDAMYDITNNGGIERIDDTNAKIAALEARVGNEGNPEEEIPASGIISTQLEILDNIGNLQSQLAGLETTIDGLTQTVDYVNVTSQLESFQNDLEAADKRLVIISNTVPSTDSVSQYAILLQTT